MVKLNQVTVPCLDLAASVDFYRRLGLHLIVHDPPRYARFECPSGDSTFSLHLADRVESASAPVVYFELDDLDARVRALLVGADCLTVCPPVRLTIDRPIV